MEFIKKIQHRLHDRMIKKQVAESKATRNSVAFAEAIHFAILFNATELNERQTVLKYAETLRKQKKQVKLLGFLNEKEKQENFTFDHFCNQELSWIGKNKSELVEAFIQGSFDLLFCMHEDQPLVDIAARSKASLRVGPAIADHDPFDLMIEKENLSLSKFIEQMEFFAKKINRKADV